MKQTRFYRVIVAIAMMLIGWLPSLAHDFEVEGIFYNKTSDNTVAVTYKGNSYDSFTREYAGDVVIPSSVNYNGATYSVTSIRDEAFHSSSSLTSVVIGNSVTSIGGSAFHSCSSLTSVVIGNSVTSIGGSAFHSCSSLTSVVIGNSVTSIGNSAFYKCESLTSIEIPNSVTSIGNSAFSYCPSLTSIVVDAGNSIYDSRNDCNAIIETASNTLIAGCQNTIIPNSVTSIGKYAFGYCSSLTSIEIPNSVTSIGKYAFAHCSSLTSIEIPNSVTSIDNDAFENCTSLTSIEIPNSVTSIGAYAFRVCTSLTSIQIPNSVTSIRDDTFSFCSNLTSIEIPNSVTSIGAHAFSYCSSLTSIEIPNSVTRIGDRAFADCTSLTSVVIGNSVTSIGKSAFSSCDSLTSIEIPNSVTSIGDEAFRECDSLTSVEIGNSVTSIGGSAFHSCSSLTSVVIGNSVTSIGKSAFWGCSSLTSIQIPNSVTSIGDYAFSGCPSLTSITCHATTPPTIESGTFSSNYSADLFVPAGCKTAYEVARYWKNFTNIIELEPELEEGVTFEYEGITYKVIVKGAELAVIASESGQYSGAVVIPLSVDYNGITYSVTSIGNEAFYDCSNLTSIEIPNSVTSIGDNVFKYCSSLASIEIPNSVTHCGNELFIGCASLESVTIGSGVKTGLYNAFDSCYKLSQIVSLIPANDIFDTGNDYYFGNFDMDACTLYVPLGAKATYMEKSPWKAFTNIIEIGEPNANLVIDDFAINAGETKELAINLINAIAFTGFQVDIYIPSGLEVVAEDGNYSFELTDRKGSNHVLSALKQSNGAIRLLCYSLTNKEFIGNEGALVKFSVKASDDFVGEHEISIKDIEFTQKDETKHELEPTTAKVEGRMLAKSITLNKTEVSLEVTQTITLEATVLPESTYNKVVTWKSSDETIATVDENGVVIAVKVGEAIITATTVDGSKLSASCKVTVKPTLATSITLDKTEIELEATQTATLVATVLPELTTNKTVTWKSLDETVAIVDENGVVTAVKVGEAIITATTVDGSNLSASCKVTVKPTLATSISLNMTEVSLNATETATLVATVLPELATNKTVTWKSSDETIVTVDENGKVTAIATGEATITATTTDGSNLSASAKIVVNPTIAESITLNIESTTLKANETIELIANVLPELTTNKSVTWKSSDEAVAIVDTNGLVTAIGVGTATITATTIDGSNLSASCIVTVEATLGDVNNDAIINVTDVMTVASYILGQNPDTFIFEAADINKDSKISVTDIVAIVNIILNSEITNEAAHYARAAKQQALSSRLFINDCTIAEGETKTIAVNLTNDIAFSGFQADIKLPEGLELCQEDGEYMISLSDRKGNDHVLASAMRSDGTIRVLSYSMNLKDYAGTEGALIYLTVKATDNFVGDHEICINNITFVQADLTEYSLEPSVCHLTGTTSIEGVNSEVIVATIGDNIVVKNAKLGSNVRVYATDGSIITSELATDGDVVVEAPVKGIFVVAIDGKSFKVMVR